MTAREGEDLDNAIDTRTRQDLTDVYFFKDCESLLLLNEEEAHIIWPILNAIVYEVKYLAQLPAFDELAVHGVLQSDKLVAKIGMLLATVEC